MSYVAAAYGIVAVTLLAYGLHLVRERRQLRRSLVERGASSPPNRTERTPAS